MTIEELKGREVFYLCAEKLFLDGKVSDPDEEEFLAEITRYAAGLYCPCAASVLKRAVFSCIELICSDVQSLKDRIGVVIEELVTLGDLVEVDSCESDTRRSVLIYLAQPSFIQRRSGAVQLVGVTPAGKSLLPEYLMRRVHRSGVVRTLFAESDENLRESLSAFGLQELADTAWTKQPKCLEARELIGFYIEKLSQRKIVSDVQDVQILGLGKSVKHYSSRWQKPENISGIYVGRRPQAYGAPLWGLYEIQNGCVSRFIDFPMRKIGRGCDEAWHLQMAFDDQSNQPQKYEKKIMGDSVLLNIFSPIPDWAFRRLMLIGDLATPRVALISLRIPACEWAEEEEFLRNVLWLVPENKE